MKTLKEQFKESINFEDFCRIADDLISNAYSSSNPSEKILERYVDKHVSSKEHIYKLFGEKLKIEKEIDVTLGHREVDNAICEFKLYLSTNKKFIFAKSFMDCISYSDFLSNTLSMEFDIFGNKMPKGMKISKALTKLLLPEHHHEVTTKHSMIYQKLFTKGKVVLSIDPIDYITMSSNNSGWRSCHRLNGGEFAAGPLAYLNDPSTVICYIESRTPCTINGNITYSNKTWRQIALVSPELKYSIQERQYPNDNSMNAKAVAEMFKELFEKYNDEKYNDEIVSVGKLADLHVDYSTVSGEDRLYYNDILNDMFSHGIVVYPKSTSIRELRDADSDIKPLKGSDAWCLDCGDYIHHPDSPFCENCYEEEVEEEW